MDLKNARLMITNDDCIHAHGIKLLEKIARQLSDDVWVIAPEAEQSAKSHSLTLHRPLRKVKMGPQAYAVSGTPTDCVIMGVHHILRDNPPHLILSGINHGINLGEDVHYSGTIAAAVEASMLGVQAIAMSFQSSHTGETHEHWETVEHYLPDLLEKLTKIGWPKGVLLNINFPNVPPEDVRGVQIVRQGKREAGFSLVETLNPRNIPYFWISGYEQMKMGEENTDLRAVDEQYISITPLAIDLTHDETMEALKKEF